MFLIDDLRFAMSIARMALLGIGLLLLIITGVGLVLLVLVGRRAFVMYQEGGCPIKSRPWSDVDLQKKKEEIAAYGRRFMPRSRSEIEPPV
ncbi:hypothetical protein DSECCO2_294420 [anaerobic digester metagenome]